MEPSAEFPYLVVPFAQLAEMGIVKKLDLTKIHVTGMWVLVG